MNFALSLFAQSKLDFMCFFLLHLFIFLSNYFLSLLLQKIIRIGIVYKGEERHHADRYLVRSVDFFNDTQRFRVLDLFDFDSSRKRMSIIVKDLRSEQIFIYCKGADNAVLKRCVEGNREQCNESIKRFSKQGWRTIVLSYRQLTQDQYKELKQELKTINNNLINREKALNEFINNKIEKDLVLVGATAVEDKLQEDVAETLEALRRAGIKIWVLTGDKTETGESQNQLKYPILTQFIY